MDESLRCSKCGEHKPKGEFYRRAQATKRGYTSHCQACDKTKRDEWYPEWSKSEKGKRSILRSRIERRYNLTLEQFEEMNKSQCGLCLICGKPEDLGSLLSVDHSHQTGSVRGLLCRKCNNGLGCFDDRIELLKNAVAYMLEKGE